MRDYVDIQDFGGLRLNAEPSEFAAEGAVYADNIYLDIPGRIRNRPGWLRSQGAAPAAGSILEATFVSNTRPGAMVRSTSAPGAVTAESYNGLTVDAISAEVVKQGGFADYANPAAPVRLVMSVGAGILRQWDGTTESLLVDISAITGLTSGSYGHLAVTPWDQRLVYAAGSHVWFSKEGDPATFDANWFEAPSPAEGNVDGVTAWGDFVFVFKGRTMHVFTSTSVDGVGNPAFNYRTYQLEGPLCAAAGAPRVQGGHLGVCFATQHALWRTRGGPPERISAPVDRMLAQDWDRTFGFRLTAGSSNAFQCLGVVPFGEDLYCPLQTFQASAPDACPYLILHGKTGQWTIHQAANNIVPLENLFGASGTPRLAGFPYLLARGAHSGSTFDGQSIVSSTGSSADITTPAGANVQFTPYWQSGFGFGRPGGDTVVRAIDIHALQPVYPGITSKLSVLPGFPGPVPLVNDAGQLRYSVRGELLSLGLSGYNGLAFDVRRAGLWVEPPRGGGDRSDT